MKRDECVLVLVTANIIEDIYPYHQTWPSPRVPVLKQSSKNQQLQQQQKGERKKGIATVGVRYLLRHKFIVTH